MQITTGSNFYEQTGTDPSTPIKTEPTAAVDTTDDNAPWWNSYGSDAYSYAGQTLTQQTLLTISAAYACTKALSESIAGLPKILYKRNDGFREKIENSFASELLGDAPNDDMDSFTFWELAIARVVNRGNFFAEIERDRTGKITNLWPIHNSRVEPFLDENGSLYWTIMNDYSGVPEYHDPTWRRQNMYVLSDRNMLNIVGGFSHSGIIAPGLLPFIGQEGSVELATRKYGSRFFENGGLPSGIVEHPSWIDSNEKRQQFRYDLNRIHSAEAGRIGVLWQGAKWANISVSPEQAQFLESRKFSTSSICKFYQVPPPVIGDVSENKYATADSMIRHFVLLTLRNLAVRIEKAIYRQVLNERRDGVLKRAFTQPYIFEIAMEGLLRGDPKTQAETDAILRTAGAITTNEMRAKHNLPPVDKSDGGEMLIVSSGTAELKFANEQGNRDANIANNPGNNPGGVGNDPDEDEQAMQVPAFDRQALAEDIAKLIPKNQGHSRGVTLDVDVEAFKESFIAEQIEQTRAVVKTQLKRWDGKDIADEKKSAWREKQSKRMHKSLCPLINLGENNQWLEMVSDTVVKTLLAEPDTTWNVKGILDDLNGD